MFLMFLVVCYEQIFITNKARFFDFPCPDSQPPLKIALWRV